MHDAYDQFQEETARKEKEVELERQREQELLQLCARELEEALQRDREYTQNISRSL